MTEGTHDWLTEMTIEELRRKIWMNADSETAEVIAVMKEELNARFTVNPFTDESAILADVLAGYTEEDLNGILMDNFTHLYDRRGEYLDIVGWLKNEEPIRDGAVTIDLRAGRNALAGSGSDWYVFGREEGEEEPVELTYCPWREWLGFHIVPAQLRLVGIPLFMTVALVNMTKAGMSEEEIQKEFDAIQQDMALLAEDEFGEGSEEE